MQTVTASEFEARCLALMDDVARTGTPIQVIRDGRAVAELHPVKSERPLSPFGLHRGINAIVGDIMEPIGPAEEWEAFTADGKY